jgi:hypothetical protein
MTVRQRLPLALGLLLLLPGAGRAGDVDGSWPPPAVVLDVTPAPPGEAPPAPLTDCFHDAGCPCGPDCLDDRHFFVQVLTGVYVSCIGPGAAFDPTRPFQVEGPPPFDYANVNVRLGYRPWLPAPEWPEWAFDRVQVMLDFQAAPVYHGFGHYAFGPSLMLRLDLCDPESRLVPYIQGGAGLAFTDGFKDEHQRAIGQWQEFLLQGSAGLRLRLSDNWSLDVEGGWQHISNACLASRNAGINTLGGSVGVTYTFGARERCCCDLGCGGE